MTKSLIALNKITDYSALSIISNDSSNGIKLNFTI